MNTTIQIPQKLIPILFQSTKKHRAIKGGRSSAKSESIGRFIDSVGIDCKGNILCTRSVQNSITDSVYGLLVRLIKDLDLEQFYTILRNEIISNKTGGKIIFKGMNALADMKKQGVKGLNDIAYVWFEEASTATEQELDMLIPSIRGVKLPDGTEVEPILIYSYNAQDCPCAVSEMIEPHEDAELAVIHYYDNPFLPETMKKEIAHLKKVAYEKYKEIYLGIPSINTSNKVILQAWIDSAVRLYKKENDGDFVTAIDPYDEGADCHACAVRKGLALIQLESWQGGDTGDATRKMVSTIIKEKQSHVIYDSVGVGAGVKSELNRLKDDGLIKNITSITPHSNGEEVKHKHSIYRIRGAETGKKNKDQFSNFGAQHWFTVRELFENAYLHEQGRWDGDYITINPDLKDLKSLMIELKQIEFEPDSKLRTKIVKQPKGTKSPNKADAVMMAFRKPRILAEPIFF